MIEPRQLGFVGGQYIIINSGKFLANGKLGKRAYSIITPDVDQEHFELVVKKINNGVGSNFIHELKKGDTFEFSGPWGKYRICEGDQNQRILCIATDTGITAVLGLLRGQAATHFLSASRLIWFVSLPNYFIPIDKIRSWLPSSLSLQIVSSVPPIEDQSRISFIEEEMSKMLQGRNFIKIYLSGDGSVLTELKNWFLKQGYTEEQIFMESFFHHERLKTQNMVSVNG